MTTATINSTDFSRAISRVAKVVEANAIVPAASTIFCVCRGNVAGEGATLHLVGTNLETTLITSLPIACAENWTACVDAALLEKTVSGLPSAPITATLDGNVLTLKSGGSKYKLTTLSAADFPKAQKLADVFKTITLPANVLCEALRATLEVSSRALDVGRPFTNGILVETTNHYLAFVAYSDNRLCVWTLHVDEGAIINAEPSAQNTVWPIEPTKLLLSRSSANLLYNALDAKSTQAVTLQMDESSVRLADNSWQTRPMENTFFDWAQIIPSAAPIRHLSVEKDDLVNALRRLQGYAPTQTQLVVFCLDADDAQFVLKASDPYIGNEGEEIVYGEYYGERSLIGFPASKLMDLLKLYPAGRIRLAFVGDGAGAMITSVADEELPTLTCIITAMRVTEPAA